MTNDEKTENTFHVTHAAEPLFGQQLESEDGFLLVNVHDPSKCAGEYCVIHNPSDHSMRDFPLNWRGDNGLMERICPHGIGHPDPDALAFQIKIGNEWQATHGCDGCCR
jgi:hypothetical protein